MVEVLNATVAANKGETGKLNYKALQTNILNNVKKTSMVNRLNFVARPQYIMDTHGFKQLITEPTRETVSSKTLIDHIYVNNEHNFSSAGVIPLGISDHHLICYSKESQIRFKPTHQHSV